MRRFTVFCVLCVLLSVPVLGAADVGSVNYDNGTSNIIVKSIPVNRIEYMGQFPVVPVVDVSSTEVDYNYVRSYGLSVYDSAVVMVTSAGDKVCVFGVSDGSVRFVSHSIFALGIASGTSAFNRVVASYNSAYGLYIYTGYYGMLQQYIPSFPGLSAGVTAFMQDYADNVGSPVDYGSLFGFFPLGLGVGIVLSALPWAIGYAVSNIRRWFMAG